MSASCSLIFLAIAFITSCRVASIPNQIKRLLRQKFTCRSKVNISFSLLLQPDIINYLLHSVLMHIFHLHLHVVFICICRVLIYKIFRNMGNSPDQENQFLTNLSYTRRYYSSSLVLLLSSLISYRLQSLESTPLTPNVLPINFTGLSLPSIIIASQCKVFLGTMELCFLIVIYQQGLSLNSFSRGKLKFTFII